MCTFSSGNVQAFNRVVRDSASAWHSNHLSSCKTGKQYSYTFTPLEGASTAVILFDVPFCLYFIKHIIEWIQYTRLRSSVCSKVPKVWIPCQIVRYPGPLFYAIASCRSRVPLIASFVLLMVMRPPLASHRALISYVRRTQIPFISEVRHSFVQYARTQSSRPHTHQ